MYHAPNPVNDVFTFVVDGGLRYDMRTTPSASATHVAGQER